MDGWMDGWDYGGGLDGWMQVCNRVIDGLCDEMKCLYPGYQKL